jgi:hypothetical protein
MNRNTTQADDEAEDGEMFHRKTPFPVDLADATVKLNPQGHSADVIGITDLPVHSNDSSERSGARAQ